ncbi:MULTISPECIES: EF-P 5-aminopentanol modification-associated protein YfmF [Bacillaceae]|uniref:EF-P 5-aminopentanol modification-associated protein YfmF n=1 Tax=Bacillaceae TaxID=186817 RepID=UPI001C1264C6|nr:MULTISPECIES: pitrilysin family protein [Bacillaceae]MBU5343604.1 insulinase family protein [Caldifermentibacillus hisashii]MCM3476464.1 insulinase family protein [Caldibacillus thermoamylovorans]MEC5272177.1 pitrilysin family protein [Caldifermentibacillus hisashii]
MEKVIDNPGVKLHLVKTDKYKTNTIVFKMKAPIEKEYATTRALLPYVLQSGTNTYPSFTELRTYLENLYGATLSVDLQKKGEYHIISITMEVANEKFLKQSEPLLDKALTLLADVLFNPRSANDSFDEQIIAKEKRTLKQRIQAVNDDKMRYANLRLIQEMCKDEPYAIPVNGILEDVDKITAQSLYSYYQDSLSSDELDLYIVGDFTDEEVIQSCQAKFQLKSRTPKKIKQTNISKRVKENVIIEKQDVAQGKLNMGLRTNTRYGEDDYFALQVFNGLFGGFPHSKLFINVREKASLAYYAASRLESHKGLMLVMTGIETKNYEKAVTIIKEQLQVMKNGDFTEADIEQTKAVIQNQMLETLDTSRGLVEVLYHNVISGANVSEEVWKEKIANVTKENIIQVGEKIQLDTIYFLSGLEA